MLVRISTAKALGADVVDAVPELERTADTVLSGTLVDRADLNRVLRTLRRLRAEGRVGRRRARASHDRHMIPSSRADLTAVDREDAPSLR